MTVPAHRNYKVANHKPVPVTVYDYYDRAQTARLFYEPTRAKTCDICDGDECGSSCNSIKSGSEESQNGSGDPSNKIRASGSHVRHHTSSIGTVAGSILTFLLVKCILH